MKALLEKIAKLKKPATDVEVSNLIAHLDTYIEKGTNISIPVLEEVLKHYKAELKKILSKELLEWMMENDMDAFETEDYKVAVKTYVNASMADKDNPDKAFEWLTKHQYGDLIKTSVDFPKGEFTDEAQGKLAKMGLSFTRKDGIAPASLKKIISDRLQAGESLPDEEQGIKVSYYDECQVKEK